MGKDIVKMIEKATRNEGKWVKGGMPWMCRYVRGTYEVLHYGYEILIVDSVNRRFQVDEWAYSISDVRCINSVLGELGFMERVGLKEGKIGVKVV